MEEKNLPEQVSVLRAFRSIQGLFACNIERNPRGYGKQWEIRMEATELEGSFACYRQGSFVTYCINIGGKDFWFDRYELAIAALSNKTLQTVHSEENFLS